MPVLTQFHTHVLTRTFSHTHNLICTISHAESHTHNPIHAQSHTHNLSLLKFPRKKIFHQILLGCSFWKKSKHSNKKLKRYKKKKIGWHLGWLMQKFVVTFRQKNILEGHFEQQMRNLNWKFYGLFEARDELIWLMKSGSRKIRLKDFLTKSRRKKHTKKFVW